VFSGCTNKGYKSIEEAIQQGGIKYKQIYHQHEVNKGIITFYENPKGGIDAGIVYKNSDRYRWGFGGGTVSFPNEGDVTWGAVNLDLNAKNEEEKHYWLYYGIINEAQIVRLHIEHKSPDKHIDKDAEIIELPDGYRLWFALQDKKSYSQPGFILTGYDKDGINVFHFE
jgi:hypothetical protein